MALNCPPWEREEIDEDVPSVASGLIDFQRFIYNKAKTYILQHGDLKTWHGKIFKDVVPLNYYAGNYRADDPRYPCLRVDVGIGGAPGAPFAEVPDLMRRFSDDMRTYIGQTDGFLQRNPTPTDGARSVVQLAATLSGRFLQIHPFLNCNGRTSRMIANYVFHRYGYQMPFYNPYPRPGPPYGNVTAPCMAGDFQPLYQYLLSVLAAS